MSETRHVDDLSAHEFNREIYNTNATDLIERIEENGYQENFGRVTIKPDGTILSGHRRWKAAQACGVDEIPVEIVKPETELEEQRLILLANEYRDKTPAEKIREGEAWERVESEKAKERNSETGGASPEKLPDTDKGETREKVGEKIGVSGRTYEEGKKVKQKAEQGDETAQEQWEKLETGEQSIHGAAREVKKSENKTKEEKPKTGTTDPRDEHTKLKLLRVLDDGAAIYTSGNNTFIVEREEQP